MPLANSGDEESDLQACPLPRVDIGEEENTIDEKSVTSHGSTLYLGSQVKKFFQGLGCFSGEFVDTLLYEGNTQMYTIIFNDGEEEMWSAHDATVNYEADSINIGDCGFQLISKFCGGGHFNGTVVEILCGVKRNHKLCDGDEYKYMLSEIQRLSTLQVISELVEKKTDSKSEDDSSVYLTEEESYGEGETIEKLEKLKRFNNGNAPPAERFLCQRLQW